ncbi:VOC family protein [Allobranchiibius sp. CTAmp26]|uniref:VOC family protein n=1 Tax=Allobranchiibius sp. CTAmp26 TaxID=2815214 RepID=UPI001AA16814|nr:VOC family protein [Allobranchiibius sp. CTAmp26]MBO1755739.1 VOC family protein [Allobranchiibius sp. CTAmp26]
MGETEQRTYPAGVTCWVDTDQPDVEAARQFYGDLLGWTFADAMPSAAPSRYVIAQRDGRDAAAIAGPAEGAARWNTYVAVDDVDAATARLAGLGARVVSPPVDVGPGGRTAAIADPEGVPLRLWQARERRGAQIANSPGAWNFSDLHTADPAAAASFYSEAFQWQIADQGWLTSIRVSGYGDHLEHTVDPEIRTRNAKAPEGFVDVIGGIQHTGKGEEPHWHVTFSVADRDESVAKVERLGGTVLRSFETDWVHAATIQDPQGAVLTLSQFAPENW